MTGHNRSAPHTALAQAAEEYLRLCGAWTYRVIGGLGSRRGVPDILAGIRIPHTALAALIAVECKTGRGELTATQQRERDVLQQAGAVYCECRSLEDLEDALYDAGLIAERSLWPRRAEAGR